MMIMMLVMLMMLIITGIMISQAGRRSPIRRGVSMKLDLGPTCPFCSCFPGGNGQQVLLNIWYSI